MMKSRFFSPSVLFSSVFFILIQPAFSGTPRLTDLAKLLDSPVGHAVLKTPQGHRLQNTLLGRPLRGMEEDLPALLERLSLPDPQMTLVREELSRRLEKIRAETNKLGPEENEGNPLNSRQHERIRKLTLQYFEMERSPRENSIRFLSSAENKSFSVSALEFMGGEQAPALDTDWQKAYRETKRLYQRACKNNPELQKFLTENAVSYLLSDIELVSPVEQLHSLLQGLAKNQSSRSLTNKLQTQLEKILTDSVPEKTIQPRIEALLQGDADALTLRRALGEMTLDEVQLWVHGGDPLHPTPDSLLGQYIEKTGAATLIRSFPKHATNGCAGGSPGNGPKRLVVALSEQSLGEYNRLFSAINFLTHLHTPQQGTLMVVFEGKAGSYAHANNDFRLPQIGTILPTILLSSTEGERAGQFFALAEINSAAQAPWQISTTAAVGNGSLPKKAYCSPGAYQNCTSWFPNIPIGGRLTPKYSFPGKWDSSARYAMSRKPVVTGLREYEGQPPDVHQVWKAPYGNEQLAEVIGLGKENLRAELVNPGWVAVSLTGAAPTERVPVVFYVVQDHRLPILKNFDPRIAPQ